MDNTVQERLITSGAEEGGSLKGRISDESKKIWKVALPGIIARVTSFGVVVVTQSFIGHVSSSDLTGHALVQTLSVRFVNGILIGMSSATETLCGQAYGAKQFHMMGIFLQRSWLVDLITQTILLPVFIFGAQIFKLLGQEESVLEAAGDISLWFIPYLYALIFVLTIQMYLQAQQKNTIIAWLSVIQFLIHIPISWLFVYKLNWGVSGAMGALNLSAWFLVIGEFVYIFGGWCPDTWKGFRIAAFKDILPVVKLSISSGVMVCLELWYYAILVLIAGYLRNAEVAISAFSIWNICMVRTNGIMELWYYAFLVLIAGYLRNAEVAISAFSICLNIVAWETMISIGLMGAACVRVANELGKGDAKAIRFSIKVQLVTSISLGVLFWILCLVFGKKLGYLFSNDEEVVKSVADLSILLGFSILLNIIYPIFSGVAVGAGLQTTVAIINFFCYYIIGIPIGVLLGYVTDLQVKGIWGGMLCGVLVETIALCFMAWRTNWDEEEIKARARLGRWYLESPNKSNEKSGNA